MLKRELKVNLKSFIIWSTISALLLICGFCIYPSFIQTGELTLDSMLKTMPEELLKMFNMDLFGIETVYNWIQTEGYTFILIIGGLFSTFLGGTILLKEESEKTIDYLASKPVSRNRIISSKVLCGIIYISSLVLIIFIINFIGLTLSCDFSFKDLILMSVAPLLALIPLFFISMYISTFFNKTKKVTGINMGIVFVTYFFMIFSNMSKDFEYLKYFSLYSLTDLRNIIPIGEISFAKIGISLIISLIFSVLTYFRYNHKEFV